MSYLHIPKFLVKSKILPQSSRTKIGNTSQERKPIISGQGSWNSEVWHLPEQQQKGQ